MRCVGYYYYHRGRFTGIVRLVKKCFVVFVTEIEAKEACKWLRAAGFPQYAQMYEGEY